MVFQPQSGSRSRHRNQIAARKLSWFAGGNLYLGCRAGCLHLDRLLCSASTADLFLVWLFRLSLEVRAESSAADYLVHMSFVR